MNLTLPEIFRYRYDGKNFNNRSLYESAIQLGEYISLHTNEGDIVLLAKKTGDELFAAFIGCVLYKRKPLIIQRPSAKVHSEIFVKRMTDIQEKVHVSLCICEPPDLSVYSPYFTTICELKPVETISETFELPDNDDVAFLQMSSGTTGVSKICEVTHRILINQCLEYGRIIGMDSTKKVVSWLPLYHDMGLIAAFLLPLIHDATFEMMDPFDWMMDPKKILEVASNSKGTHMWMPNFAFKHLLNKVNLDDVATLDLSSLEKVISCSEPSFADVLESFVDKFSAINLSPSAVSNCYALAENVFAVSQSEGIKTREWKGITYTSCGKLLPGVSISIVKDGTIVNNKDDGSIMLRSPYTPETNIKSDFFDYYDTGDIGFMLDDELYVIGRKKDFFVSYGVNVYPEIIEHKLSTIEGVIPGRAVCFGVFSEEQGTSKLFICAEVEDITNNKIRLAISNAVKSQFDLSPTVKLIPHGGLIKTSSGKFSRKENRTKYGH